MFAPAPPELSYDLVHPARAAMAGLRTVLWPAAISGEVARQRTSREYRSRVRLALSAYAFTAWVVGQTRQLPLLYVFQIGGAKVLRWLTPLLYAVTILSALLQSQWLLAGVLAAGLATPFFGVVVIAYLAGLGFVGKNTNLIHRQRGSFFFLGGLILDRELPFDPPDPIGSCGTRGRRSERLLDPRAESEGRLLHLTARLDAQHGELALTKSTI